jgi:hypothetical protein
VNTAHAERVYFEQIKRMVPIEAVLARYGALDGLKRSGRQLVGRCPVHRGSNKRQFCVDLDKNVWKCFSPDCGRGGSVLELVALMDNVDVREAALRLADWFAIRAGENLQLKRRRKQVSGQPSHKAFVVEDRGEGEDKDAFWTRVGSAWPHGDGKGLNVQIAPGLSVSGRLVLREYTSEDAEEEKKTAAKKRK